MFFIDVNTESYYSILGVMPTATFEEIREARDRLIRGLREQQIDTRSEADRARFEARQKEINLVGETLARPDRRDEYDRDHAHLRFFVIQSAAAPLFADKGERLRIVHRQAARFLEQKGSSLSPLTDLDRRDFATDETLVPALEGLLREEPFGKE